MTDPSWRWRFQSPHRNTSRRRARVVSSRRSSDGDEDEDAAAMMASSKSQIGGGMRIPAPRFLLGPAAQPLVRSATTSMSPGRRPYHSNAVGGSGTSSSLPQQNPSSSSSSTCSTPFLTMALLKLEQIFPDFCLPLAQASWENITRACAVLDTASLATSPSNSVGSPRSQPRSPRSPTSHHIGFLNWLPESPRRRGHTRSLSPPTANTPATALALESEWDALQHGFLVLATAEYLYQDMQQLKRGHSLRGLYDYVQTQFVQIRATLCEPFLSIPRGTALRENKYISAARSVARTLQTFLTLCQVRMQLIDLQSNLFTVGDLSEVKDSIGNLLTATEASFQDMAANSGVEEEGDNEEPSTAAAADPVRDALIQELKTWKYLLESCAGLERCQ